MFPAAPAVTAKIGNHSDVRRRSLNSGHLVPPARGKDAAIGRERNLPAFPRDLAPRRTHTQTLGLSTRPLHPAPPPGSTWNCSMALSGSVQLVSVSFRSSPLATPRSCSPANMADAPAPIRLGAPSPPRSPGTAALAAGPAAVRSPGPRGPPELRSPAPSSSARFRPQRGSPRTAAAHFRPAQEPGPPANRLPGNAAAAPERFPATAPRPSPGGDGARRRCQEDAQGV